MDPQVRDAVQERAVEGRLACAAALALAHEMGLPPARIGQAANALGIKITDCQLGCFGKGRKDGRSQ